MSFFCLSYLSGSRRGRRNSFRLKQHLLCVCVWVCFVLPASECFVVRWPRRNICSCFGETVQLRTVCLMCKIRRHWMRRLHSADKGEARRGENSCHFCLPWVSWGWRETLCWCCSNCPYVLPTGMSSRTKITEILLHWYWVTWGVFVFCHWNMRALTNPLPPHGSFI